MRADKGIHLGRRVGNQLNDARRVQPKHLQRKFLQQIGVEQLGNGLQPARLSCSEVSWS